MDHCVEGQWLGNWIWMDQNKYNSRYVNTFCYIYWMISFMYFNTYIYKFFSQIGGPISNLTIFLIWFLISKFWYLISDIWFWILDFGFRSWNHVVRCFNFDSWFLIFFFLQAKAKLKLGGSFLKIKNRVLTGSHILELTKLFSKGISNTILVWQILSK